MMGQGVVLSTKEGVLSDLYGYRLDRVGSIREYKLFSFFTFGKQHFRRV